MISLVEHIPDFDVLNAEWVKIKCLYQAYKSDDKVLFWTQNKENAVISLVDGNMIIYNNNADCEELSEFVDMLSPACVFSDYNTLCTIGKKPDERINIVWRNADIEGETKGDSLLSREIYNLLNVKGLSLPEYPDFLVDYCHRLNMGKADYFAVSAKGAAITFNCGDMAIMNGIASHEKGFGSIALRAILQKNYGRKFIVCCRDSVLNFYLKNGFEPLYYGGYWVKNK